MNKWPVRTELLNSKTIWFGVLADLMTKHHLLRKSSSLRRSNADIKLVKAVFRTYGINLIFRQLTAKTKSDSRFKLCYMCFKTEKDKTFWMLQSRYKGEDDL